MSALHPMSITERKRTIIPDAFVSSRHVVISDHRVSCYA